MPETLFYNYRPEVTPIYLSPQSKEINRLLCAAIVSTKFRNTLINDPAAAIEAGYHGETFNLEPDQIGMIMSVQANDLPEFGRQLIDLRERSLKEQSFIPLETSWQSSSISM